MKHLISQTIKLKGRFQITTRLSSRNVASLEMERARLENLWTEARQNFAHYYDEYLLVENQNKQSKLNLFFGVSSRAIARSVAEFTRRHLADSSRYFEAVRYLDETAAAGLAACQRICNVIFHAYGGEGAFDLVRTGGTMQRAGGEKGPGDEGKSQPATLESAAWIITQTIDRTTFYTALASARSFHMLGSAQGKCLNPLQKREIISAALTPLLTNLMHRARASSVPETFGASSSSK